MISFWAWLFWNPFPDNTKDGAGPGDGGSDNDGPH